MQLNHMNFGIFSTLHLTPFWLPCLECRWLANVHYLMMTYGMSWVTVANRVSHPTLQRVEQFSIHCCCVCACVGQTYILVVLFIEFRKMQPSE